MDRESVFTTIMSMFVLIVVIKMYFESDMFQLKCIVSNVNGNTYCVRERSKAPLVVDLLAKISDKMEYLIEHLKTHHNDRENVQRIVSKFNPKKISETLPTSKFTAYSENKGQKLAFCTNTKKNGDTLIDENTLTFVALHEMSHIMTKSIGHKKEFWNNFRFLLHNAVDIGIYKPEDYKKQPKSYCGMYISDNPYYDM
jgi:hypothetical protein